MLKKRKTFDLDRERVLNQPKCDQLNEPKKSKYLKYIAIPAVIALILLCILVYVDFTGEAYNYLNEEINHQENEFISTAELQSYVLTEITNRYNNDQQVTTKIYSNLENEMLKNSESNLKVTTKGEIQYDAEKSKYVSIMMNEISNETMELKQNMLQESTELTQNTLQETTELTVTETYPNPAAIFNSFASAAKCVATKTNCSLYCSGGSLGFIDEDLNSLRYQCPKTDLSLIIQDCEFYKGILSSALFTGDFVLKYLSISNSNLEKIDAWAFKQPNVQNLQTLILRNNLLTTLTATTFDGLGSLNYFEFIQQPIETTFNGVDFLKPMASSLTDALFTQMSGKQEVLNPTTWLQGSNLAALITLDMSNNNFQDILNPTTFRTLIVIQNLLLINCSLSSLTDQIFDPIVGTLKKLDLSNNFLQTFDLAFLNSVSTHNIKTNLSGNEWYCDCDDNEIIDFFKENIQITETIICYEPEKWRNMELKQVIVECIDDYSTTTTTTTSPITNTIEYSEDSTTENDNITTSKASEDSPSSTSSKPSYSTEITTMSDSSESSITTENSLTTTLAPNLKEIVCHDLNKTETTFWLYHIIFIITTTSASSVAIKIPDSLYYFDILCFTNHNNYMNLSQMQYIMSNNIVFIQKLVSRTTYIFCLITNPQVTVSPLQCQGHFVGIISTPWLLDKDQFWFIPVIIIISLIILIFSILVVNAILRKYPTWLINRNERILKVSKSDDKVIILSKKTEEDESSFSYLAAQQLTKQAIYAKSNKTSLYASQHTVPVVRAPTLPPITENRKSSCPSYTTAINNNASNYIPVIVNRFKSSNDEDNSLYISQNNAPFVRAPPLPPCSLYKKSHTCLKYVDNDPDYQTIDHYEVVNF